MDTAGNKISLRLKNDKTVYRPGETLYGQAEWEFAKDIQEISIQVFWYTTGRGDSEAETVKTETISMPLKSDKQDFAIELPMAPYSFKGQITGLNWAVKAEALKGKVSALKEFSMAPTGEALKLEKVAGAESKVEKFLQNLKNKK